MNKNSNVVGPLLEGEGSNIQHVLFEKMIPEMQGICILQIRRFLRPSAINKIRLFKQKT